MKKVKLDVIKPWIAEKVTELLGFEDEVLIGYIFGLLEEKVFIYFIIKYLFIF
jgi:serine/arginine repetitive matrix protein 1